MVNKNNQLIGNKIYLRPLTLQDVTSKYVHWLQDNEVMQGIATSGYDIENLKKYVNTKINNSQVSFFAICDKITDEHIGNIKVEIQDTNAEVADLGLLIGNKSYWGKGIGYETCKLTLLYAFNELNLRKVYLAVYENNPAAKKLYEKLGFKLEATLRKHVIVNGIYYDKYLMGLFKEELK